MDKIRPFLDRPIDPKEARKLPASTIMELYYPLLDYLPHVAYRSMAELILFAIAIRSNRVFKDKHPAFVLFGRTMAFKTRFAYFISHMIGRPIEKTIHNMMLETRKSTIIRRDARGEIQYVSDVLSEPFVDFDEYLFADDQVRHMLKVFIDGRIKTPVENKTLTILCVPLITTNPNKDAKRMTLKELLFIDEPQIRRSVILFADTLGLDDRWLIRYGEDLLNLAAQSKPIPLRNFRPPKKKIFTRDDKDAVFDIVEEYLHPEIFKSRYVDIDMLVQLAVGAMAYIPVPDKALKRVLQNYFRIIASNGWIKPNKLQNLFGKSEANKIRRNIYRIFRNNPLF